LWLHLHHSIPSPQGLELGLANPLRSPARLLRKFHAYVTSSGQVTQLEVISLQVSLLPFSVYHDHRLVYIGPMRFANPQVLALRHPDLERGLARHIARDHGGR